MKRCDFEGKTIILCPREPSVATDAFGAPAITITDLAQFTPAAVALTTEPAAAGVSGLPVNFTASASVHTRSGTLFGQPVTVRFTPAGYDYTYGDGTSATLTDPGRAWQLLDSAPFSPTPTSHTYTRRGTYTASLTIRYTAEVDLGTGFRPVPGELSAASPPQQIRVFDARTALVAHTCTEIPSAPGC
ncbi:PKD domain-containing protein [Streptomyces sp. AC495_CC817]|uniref:PKD domain-containing protein n=1 Tax=Streptomyces sp. AC495_CC817 TaxID=2823900 RepID=UPI001C262848|nr:PKD domain-containing protein [Streptomyces sp. AC495_CC817]